MTTNFEFHVPTHIYFGEGVLEKVSTEVLKYGKKVLILHGSNRIKGEAWYNSMVNQMQAEGIIVYTLGGIEPNPRVSKVNEAVKICREEGIDVLLPIGGGSVIDTAKLTSPGAFYDGDAWDLIKDSSKMQKFLPIIDILTLAGTGTDLDAFGIVSKEETEEKLPFYNQNLFPTASFVVPSLTASVSKFQTACGAIDAFSHYLEVYFMRGNLAIHDRVIEGFMKGIVEAIPKVMADLGDLDARANLLWAQSWALSGFTFGTTGASPFMLHWVEDEVSAKYDITHGLGLAIIMPHYLEHFLSEDTVDLYYRLGVNVLGIDGKQDVMAVAKEAIAQLRELFFVTCELKPHLRDYIAMDDSKLEEMAKVACRNGEVHGFATMTQQDAIDILKKSM